MASKMDNDELAGISFYTHDNCTGIKQGNFFYEENIDLRKRDPKARMQMLKTWGTHVYYTLRAMGKLDDIATTVYRGMPEQELVRQEYLEGRPIQFGGWTSTTTNLVAAMGFTGADGVILKITIRTGKDINLLSFFPGEGEVLLTPNHRFIVTKEFYRDENGFCFVDLLETRAGTLNS